MRGKLAIIFFTFLLVLKLCTSPNFIFANGAMAFIQNWAQVPIGRPKLFRIFWGIFSILKRILFQGDLKFCILTI